jgi:NTP pyrophosphatase (non-canonical NTP hydrolase)
MRSGPSLDELQERQEEFKRERGWEVYHTPQNVAQALSVEANELLEVFLWDDNTPTDEIPAAQRERAREELADMVIYALSMASELDVDLAQAVAEKLDENEARFPVEDSEQG